MTRRLAIPAAGVALANLAALGLLIGLVGASRAYSVGVHTLFRDHLPAVLVALAGAGVLAFVLGRRRGTPRELAMFVGLAVATDVVGALAVTLAIDEMRRVAEFALPRAVFTETAGGLQILVIGASASIGYASARHNRAVPGWR